MYRMNKKLSRTCLILLALCSFNTAHAIDAKYRTKLEQSGCTQMSEMMGCDINKTKAENEKAGFGADSYPMHHHAYAGQWVAKNASTGRTVATIRVDNDENVWVNGKKVTAKRSDGGLVSKQGFIQYRLEGNSMHGNAGSWYDSDAQTTGPIKLE